MHFMCLKLISMASLDPESEVGLRNFHNFSIFCASVILPLYFYNQPIHKILIMIKRFAFNLFSAQKRTALFAFSSPKQSPNSSKPQPQVKNQKVERDNEYDDDAQQQFPKQDRTTPGWILYRIFFWGSTAILAYNTYLVAYHDKKTPVEEQTGAIPGFISAAKFINKNYNYATEFLTKPPLDKLLPDIVHPHIQPKTLVLNLSGTLLNTQYVFGKGLIVHKRPGLQQFLKKMSQLYQIVIFSDDDSMLLQTLTSSLDPRHQIFTGQFGHQCMVFSRGRYIKDLKYLNRDLKKVIVIDKSKAVVQKQKQNVITLTEYKGDQNDRQLVQLTSLLQNLAKPEIRDVRKTLEQMGQNPVKAYQLLMKQKQQKIKKSTGRRVFGFFEKKN